MFAVPTYDTTFQVVSWSTQKDLLFFDSFLRRHSEFALGVESLLERRWLPETGPRSKVSGRTGCYSGKIGCGRNEEQDGTQGLRRDDLTRTKPQKRALAEISASRALRTTWFVWTGKFAISDQVAIGDFCCQDLDGAEYQFARCSCYSSIAK